MVDTYAIISIVIRLVATGFLIKVVFAQFKELHRVTRLQWLKKLLIALVMIILIGNLLTISLNLFRNADGNLQTEVRQFSVIFNSLSVLATGIVLTTIYKHKE